MDDRSITDEGSHDDNDDDDDDDDDTGVDDVKMKKKGK